MTVDSEGYKRYTAQAKSGIKGEAFFELLITDYALPHRIVGSKDIGVDYICEWVYGDKPTGVLFLVQVKTFASTSVKPILVGINEGYNCLEQFEIHRESLKIEPKTLQYWKGFGLPAYLFVVVYGANSVEMECYYRRYTQPLTSTLLPDPSGEYYQGFYKVSDGNSFLAFKDPEIGKDGFARDLFIDHVRCCYSKGQITFIDPGGMGLKFPNYPFIDLFKEYEDQIRRTYNDTSKYLKDLDSHRSELEV
jgi:hypothetical protein